MKRTTQAAWVAAIVAAVGFAGLTLPTSSYAAAAPTSPYNAISVDGPATNSQMENGPFVDDAGNGTVTASGTSVEGHGAGNIVIEVQPTTAGPLAVGSYPVAASSDATHVRVDVTVGGTTCTSQSGAVDIQQVSMNGATFGTFAASYSLVCGIGPGPLHGIIRLNSTIPYAVGTTNVSAIDYTLVEEGALGAAHAVTLTSRGSADLTMGTANIGGAQSADFVITADTCSGQALAYGATCSVSVAPRPGRAGPIEASLVLPDSSSFGSTSVLLNAVSVNPISGTYSRVTPTRLLDTRIGVGAPRRSVAGGTAVALNVRNIGGVPAGAQAVVLNLTVTGPTSSGYVTVYAHGTSRPATSTINYTRGWTGANLVTAQVGSDGKVAIYNCCGHVQLVADVLGWYAANLGVTGPPASTFQVSQPQRLLDTRQWTPPGVPARFSAPVAVDYGATVNNALTALIVTVTAVRPSAGGYLTAYTNGRDPTRTSTLNLRAGVTTTNLAIVPTTKCTESWCLGDPMIWVYNGSARKVNVLVDVVGFFAKDSLPDGARYHPLAPRRIVDTRVALGAGPLGPASTTSVTPPAPLNDPDVYALISNVTAIKPTTNTFLTLWPDAPAFPRPTVSNLNPAAGSTVAEAAVLVTGVGNVVDVYNASGTTNMAIDVSATFSKFPPTPPSGLRARVALSPTPSVRAHPVLSVPDAPGPRPTAAR